MKNEGNLTNQKLDTEKISALIEAVKNNYEFSRITLILTPDTDQSIDNILKKYQIKFLRLHANNYKKWSHTDDPHWSCVGHKMAAFQVSQYLSNSKLNKSPFPN